MAVCSLPRPQPSIRLSAPSPSPPSAETHLHPFEVRKGGRIWILGATMATFFASAIEGSIVATAMPTLVAQLGDFELFSLVFTVYLLTQAVTVPIYGRLADLYGRKRVLFTGLGLFLLGSLLCGFAWSMVSLVLFRILQGLGAGALVPVGQTIIGDIYPPAERARVQGYISSVWAIAAVIGPAVGAFLVAHTTWPWIFWCNVPIGLLALLALELALRERVQQRMHRIDMLGSALMAAGVGLLMYTLSEATRASLPIFIGLLALSAALLATLIWHERRTPEPMLPLELWRHRVIAGGNLAAFAVGAIIMGTSAFLPAYIQGVMGRSPIEAGYPLMTMSVTWVVGSVAGGRLMLKASYRVAAACGGATLILGGLMMIAMTPERGVLWPALGAAINGVGLGLCNNTFQVAIQGSVDWTRRGLATSSLVFARNMGQTIGTAVFGGILNLSLADRIAGGGDLVERLMDPNLRKNLTAATANDLTLAIAAALHNVYLIVGLLSAMALLVSLSLPAGLSPLRPARRPRP
jgi:EmrB/QacA subfamily drug resistance transporter